MGSKVYFAPARVTKWKHSESLPGRLERALGELDMGRYFEKDEWVAVKTHFGSHGAHRIVRPVFLRTITNGIKAVGANPFVTDTVRIKGLDYLEVANANGINHLSVGSPVILADGLYGNDNLMVKAGELLGEVAVATAIHDVSAMVVVSHVKGHILAGYAGAVKNLAMGGVSGSHRTCGWKCGRGSMHAIGHGRLAWNGEQCELCYQCEEICPLDCIEFSEDGKKFTYDDERCWRCGRCVRVCPGDILEQEGSDDESFMRSLAEAASAVLSTFGKRKVVYVNFLTEIQPECDCMPGADVPMVQDLGILVSDDLVAVEQASMDMIRSAEPLPGSAASDRGIASGQDILAEFHKKPYYLQIEEAERLGLGSRKYDIIDI